jgi:CBS domain-containing protein
MRVTTKRSAGKTLLSMTAGDLMSAPITSIPHDMLLKDAGHLLIRSSITGTPVIDADGNCIGILSSSDFVGWAEAGGEMEEKKAGVSFIAPWGEVVSLDACEGCIVSHFMTKQPVTVPATMSIGEVAQTMINAHIHRVLVTEGKRPCGIISSIDIVAAVANAAQAAARKRKT